MQLLRIVCSYSLLVTCKYRSNYCYRPQADHSYHSLQPPPPSCPLSTTTSSITFTSHLHQLLLLLSGSIHSNSSLHHSISSSPISIDHLLAYSTRGVVPTFPVPPVLAALILRCRNRSFFLASCAAPREASLNLSSSTKVTHYFPTYFLLFSSWLAFIRVSVLN